jgi:diguanylate cyclase (GGDEF)-like protein
MPNQSEIKKIDIINTISKNTRLLTWIILFIIFILLFLNTKGIYSDHISSFSSAVILSIVTGLVLLGFYIARRISLNAINSLMHYNDELEMRVSERTGELTETVKILQENIDERKQMEDKLYSMSITDELTGLYNRRGFFTLAEHCLLLAKREKKGLLLLYADLDHLKEVNDTLGHKEGDRLIKDTADILKSTYRETDIIARIGGDEFVAFPVGSSEAQISIIANRLQNNIDNFNAKRDPIYKLSLSIGVVAYDPNSVQSLDRLLAQADKLMYDHKRNKQNKQHRI